MRASQDRRIVYDIPLEALPAYRGRRVVVRSHSPAAVVLACRHVSDGDLACVHLEGLPTDIEPLVDWGYGLAIQLAMPDPAVEFPTLYRYTRLVDKHPVRVVMPVRPGFSRAVKLATSLEMAVKLDAGQPTAAELKELAAVLDLYLNDSACSQPIEFFHGALRALCDREPITLREIQGDDPARVRRVDSDGVQWLGRHPALVPDTAECRTCQFWDICAGYFKWPQRDYDCAGIKTLLGTLVTAAAERRSDVERLGAVRADRVS